jgi:hypothetical protein
MRERLPRFVRAGRAAKSLARRELARLGSLTGRTKSAQKNFQFQSCKTLNLLGPRIGGFVAHKQVFFVSSAGGHSCSEVRLSPKRLGRRILGFPA